MARKVILLLVVLALTGCSNKYSLADLSFPGLGFGKGKEPVLTKCPAIRPQLPEPEPCRRVEGPMPIQIERLQQHVLELRETNESCYLTARQWEDIAEVWDKSWSQCE